MTCYNVAVITWLALCAGVAASMHMNVVASAIQGLYSQSSYSWVTGVNHLNLGNLRRTQNIYQMELILPTTTNYAGPTVNMLLYNVIYKFIIWLNSWWRHTVVGD